MKALNRVAIPVAELFDPKCVLYGAAGLAVAVSLTAQVPGEKSMGKEAREISPVTIFMCGDVMPGRGIDQILPHPGDPTIHESYLKDARGYVDIAERAHGHIPGDAGYAYIWGDALEELEQAHPDLRVINLETSITKSDDYWKSKGINYRMNPENIPCLTAAAIDFCALANNHVLDWGYPGLKETLETLDGAGIRYAGAGLSLPGAEAPAVFGMKPGGRILILSCGTISSGIPPGWSATGEKPGVFLLKGLSDKAVERIRECIRGMRQQGDVVVVSIHWGGNWGYSIPSEQVRFAHALIDDAGVDIVHGHSSHHVKGIEVYRDRLILYGCGDFLNDYEGISGYEQYRDDLSLMYFVSVDPSTGRLTGLRMVPTQVRRFRVHRAEKRDVMWLRDVLNREGKKFGTSVELNRDQSFSLKW
jgi:poly-gamma-glutamate capsule biosynthesis protein CapA/YwtB (metallophosphatase superfamily)